VRPTEPFRLILLAILAMLLQLAIYVGLPDWRDAIDIYLVMLLLLTTARGPYFGIMCALIGGLVMDALSSTFTVFHTLYYLVPVAVGSFTRPHMLVEFRLLGTLTSVLLILGKIIVMLLVCWAAGWLASPLFFFKINFWSLLVISVLLYLGWPWLIRLIPSLTEVKQLGY
jgi:hypothetical protein